MKSLISEMIISAIKNGKISIWQFNGLQFGEQSRDFIYVHDVVNVIIYLVATKRYFNETLDLGSGESYKFIDIAKFIASLEVDTIIESISPPIAYERKNYQQFTCANMSWLRPINSLIAPRQPYEIIPELIKHYKMFME
jgi:nucleoside-diphosphate-sugar epimerase